ncbi:hypothetical protein I545_3448 [Mycobacterium kansasii 662]|uniref:Uncharacterized protein n=2 Tax=Mycobacterium kansasii TaxID=1768 RepID=A0A1V3X5D1_MYCKA|nr:hypothetical protein I547_6072 [Mycobacterium kansasii 824]EUA17964.1 hypothetical protein I545_3448 [Mycobacterium kansasii 662]OOK74444.1 hypothetical protein BZL29_4349 [Mycobacterium kansasii]
MPRPWFSTWQPVADPWSRNPIVTPYLTILANHRTMQGIT